MHETESFTARTFDARSSLIAETTQYGSQQVRGRMILLKNR